MKRAFFMLVFFSFCSRLNAQDENSFIRLKSISIEGQVIDPGAEQLTADEIINHAVSPDMMPSVDLTGYVHGKYHFLSEGPEGTFESPSGKVNSNSLISSSRFSVLASFNFYRKKKESYRKGQELRLGIFFQPRQFQQADYIRTDTITLDSFIHNYAYYESYSSVGGIEAAYIFRTNPEKWINAYAGAGFAFGLSINPKVALTNGSMSNKITNDSLALFPHYNFTILSNTQIVEPAKSSFLLEARIPFGVDVSLMKQVCFFAESAIVFSTLNYFNGGDSYSTPIHFTAGAGLRIQI